MLTSDDATSTHRSRPRKCSVAMFAPVQFSSIRGGQSAHTRLSSSCRTKNTLWSRRTLHTMSVGDCSNAKMNGSANKLPVSIRAGSHCLIVCLSFEECMIHRAILDYSGNAFWCGRHRVLVISMCKVYDLASASVLSRSNKVMKINPEVKNLKCGLS